MFYQKGTGSKKVITAEFALELPKSHSSCPRYTLPKISSESLKPP
jgi:hypothetical protein